MINSVVIEGNLTRDAELAYTATGTAVCKFSIANNIYQGKDKPDKVNFLDCVVFGKYAEAMAKHLAKGRTVTVSGGIDQQRWESNGEKKSRVVIKVAEISLHREGKQAGNAPSHEPPPRPADEFEDDIPF